MSALEKKIRSFLKGPKKGETLELRNGLVSQYKHERKDAIQRVIQAMTVGKDVSALFPDVLKNIATYDIEQKKLVYLYLMNYAKTHPELCILAVNTFIQDTEDPNPLIRALAIRTMGCIRVAKMVDYMEIPLAKKLRDDNPYVRKTAAICVAKLFDLSPSLCVDFGFVAQLHELLSDANPMVVANALNALYEIKDMNTGVAGEVLVISAELVRNLLLCLNECTEWARITILTTLTDYTTSDREEAYHIIERVVPQLQHANPSVVLSSIKAILHHLQAVPSQRAAILKKLSAPLVSLMSLSIPEAQYVGLRNIRIILEKYPDVLSRELRVFFLKYSDPLYLKLEKLDIMVRLANDANCALLLGELKEYAMEVEPPLVARAVRAVGLVAVALPNHAVRAVNLLCSLVDQRGGDLIVNEAAPVFASVLRRYPGKNDLNLLVIPVVAHHSDELTTPDAQGAYIWMLGEYPKYFSTLHAKMTELITGFLELDAPLQLAVLTAIVKINLASTSTRYSPLLQQALEMATKECDNADVRDKAYIYWRLLSSSSTEAAKKIVLAKLPPIKSTVPSFSPAMLELLISELSTLASVYHKPAYTFVDAEHREKEPRSTSGNIDELKNLAKLEIIANSKNENLLDFDDDEEVDNGTATNGVSLMDELNDLFSAPAAPSTLTQPAAQPALQTLMNDDIMALFGNVSEPRGGSEVRDVTKGVDEVKVKDDLLDLF